MKKFLATLTLAAAFCGIASAGEIPVENWTVPHAGRLSTLADVGYPSAFVGMTPCRLVDTRTASGFPGGYGAPALAGSATARSFALQASTTCTGIPVGISAYSLNFTVIQSGAPTGGFITVFPTGGTMPTVSTLNFGGTAGLQIIANAAIVPASSATGNPISVFANFNTDLIIDINGYYPGSASLNTGTNPFEIRANNSQFAGIFRNYSTTCGGVCGLEVITDSLSANQKTISSFAFGNTNPNWAIEGYSYGTGSTSLPPVATNFSAGVYGTSSNTTANVAGVIGETKSSGLYSAGVLGLAVGASSQAGYFFNSYGTGTNVFLAEGSGSGLSTNSGAYIGGSLSVIGAKNFISPHPSDPSKQIVYAAAEGPTVDVFFRGTAHLVNGSALIQVPDHFRLSAREDSYMTTLTPVGARANLWVESEGPDGILVRGSADATFHYVIWGERDEMRDAQPIRDNTAFTPERITKLGLLKTLSARTIALLVKNGTLNPDGTFNEATARRIGWALPAPAPEAAQR